MITSCVQLKKKLNFDRLCKSETKQEGMIFDQQQFYFNRKRDKRSYESLTAIVTHELHEIMMNALKIFFRAHKRENQRFLVKKSVSK
ncbi:hypothetical protein QE422_003036 [Chryseobacterium sp. SORGH_AS 447]|nr:hypothetical protein [Chryseobacterium sp. SORGH_AS_0447]